MVSYWLQSLAIVIGPRPQHLISVSDVSLYLSISTQNLTLASDKGSYLLIYVCGLTIWPITIPNFWYKILVSAALSTTSECDIVQFHLPRVLNISLWPKIMVLAYSFTNWSQHPNLASGFSIWSQHLAQTLALTFGLCIFVLIYTHQFILDP